MTGHPNRSRARLTQYGARLRTIERRITVEMVDPNDNARTRHQYRRTDDGWVERRILQRDGLPMGDGSPWIRYAASELAALMIVRGRYHPILDALGL